MIFILSPHEVVEGDIIILNGNFYTIKTIYKKGTPQFVFGTSKIGSYCFEIIEMNTGKKDMYKISSTNVNKTRLFVTT